VAAALSTTLAIQHVFVLPQAYGEVIWFGGRVTALTLVSFIFMVRLPRFVACSPDKPLMRACVCCAGCFVHDCGLGGCGDLRR
jgi:hypothetical protein